MCYDINPLGLTMHVRELDRAALSRQASPTITRPIGISWLRLFRAVTEPKYADKGEPRQDKEMALSS